MQHVELAHHVCKISFEGKSCFLYKCKFIISSFFKNMFEIKIIFLIMS